MIAKLRHKFTDNERITPYRLLMMMAWCNTPILYYIRIFLSKHTVLGIKGDIYIATLFVILIIASLKDLQRHIKWQDIFFYIINSMLFMLQYALYPQNSGTLDSYIIIFLFTSLPYYFVGVVLDIKRFQKDFLLLSVVSILIHMLYHLWYEPQVGTSDVFTEDMVGAYHILPHVGFIIWSAFRRKNIFIGIFAAVSILFLFSMGNRGSIVCIVCFIILLCFFIVKYKHPIVVRTSMALVVGIIVLKVNQLAIFFSNWFLSLGLSDRVFSTMLSNEFVKSQGRDNINALLIQAIESGPFFGYGITGDRHFGNIVYAHNFFLEILVAFGVLVGSIIIVAFVFIVVHAFYVSRNKKEELAFLVLLIACFGKLVFSGTYLEDHEMFFLIGYCVQMIRVSHRQQSIQRKVWRS